MIKYTQAIAISDDFLYTLLIKRNNNPGKGLLSGIGGHIEDNETPEECMRREWQEEVGKPLPDNAELFPIMTEQIDDIENHMFGIIITPDIYFFNNDADGEGFIRWYHILGDHIMDIENNKIAWDGLIPYCIRLMQRRIKNAT